MGHRKKNAPVRDLHQQAYDCLVQKQAFGDSKIEDKQYDREHDTDTVSQKIYSYKSYQTYWEHTKYFIKWVNKNHTECKTLADAKPYVNEWLQQRVDEGKSAWTVSLEAAALNKLYGIHIDNPDRFQPPKRKKVDIKRSRGTAKRDVHFSEKNNEELINFCKGCGFRRGVLERLTGDDLYDRVRVESRLTEARAAGDKAIEKACNDALTMFPDQDFFILHNRDKGGKTRISPIVGPHKGKIVERMQNTKPGERVWRYVSGNCDVHSYRADYATYLYKQYARPIEALDYNHKIKCADGKMRSEIYICRDSEKGKKLDRLAIRTISIALGHNREDTAIANYVRNL